MEFKIISSAGGEPEVHYDCQDEALPFKLPASRTDVVKGRFGEMYFHHYKAEEFPIWSSVYDIREAAVFEGRADIAVLEIHGSIENQFETCWDNVMHSVQREDLYNVSFAPHVNNKATFEKGSRHRTFDIHPSVGLLEQYAPHYPLLDQFLNNVDKRAGCSFMPEGLLLTIQMKNCLEKVMTYECNPAFTISFYEWKVKEFLMMMLDRASYLQHKKVNRPKFSNHHRL